MTTPISPSVLNPTPKNGASTSQPQQPVEPKPNVAAAPDPVAEREAKLAEREKAIEKREKTFNAELGKFKDTSKGLGAKLSEYEQLKKWRTEREQQDKLEELNPIAGLERRLGKDWREKVAKLGVDGVPAADFFAEAMMRLEQRIDAKLNERDQKTAATTTAAEQSAIEETRAMVADGSRAYYEQNAKDYPLFETLGPPERIGSILGERIEAHFMKTGKMLSAKEAADQLDDQLFGIAKRASEAEKYKAKLQPETKSANVSTASGKSSGDGSTGSTQQQPGGTRRTLDNSMTASASGRVPPRSDEERLRRATEAFNAARAKGT